MDITDTLALARLVATRLGVRINDSALIIENMKQSIGVTTILYNDNFTLWIDKYYIAYSKNSSPFVVYVMVAKEHIKEELKELNKMIAVATSSCELKTLMNIKEQLEFADAVITLSNASCYVSRKAQELDTEGKIVKVNNTPMVMTLCHKCKQNYLDTEQYYIKRLEQEQPYKEKCTYCNHYDGYDYEVIPKNQKGQK